MVNRVTRTVLFAASALFYISAFGAGAARFGTLRNPDWVVTNAWQAVSNKTHDLILEIGHGDSLPPDWQNVSNAAMNAVQSLQPAYEYTDNALISFSSTGSVFRSLSYGTPNYWTDSTGCVWKVGAASGIGYNEWTCIGVPQGYSFLGIDTYSNQSGIWRLDLYNEGNSNIDSFYATGDENPQYLVFDVSDVMVEAIPNVTVTKLVGRVALTNDISQAISTNNSAFVSAVLAAPLVGADPNDLSELAEYGSYGTVGAAILALIAGLAALKRRMASAETAISGKASLTDLPYALVTPGEWTFSGLPSGYEVTSFQWLDIGGDDTGWEYEISDIGGGSFVGVVAGTETDLSVTVSISLIGVTFTATRASLPGHLLDRAVNAVSVSDTTTLTLPALVNAGKARDFLVKVTTSADDLNITWQGQGSEAPNGADELQFVTEDGDFPVVGTAGDYLFSFTEIEPHTFAVSMKPIVAAPQAQGGS